MLPHYQVRGSGAPAIVFTHGLAASSATWEAQVCALAPRFQVITWDLRGHGRSPADPSPCSPADLAGDLREALDDAGIERAVVAGHSAGGVVAMQFALSFPDRTAGLVLVGTASECNARAHEYYQTLAALADQEQIDRVRKRLGLGREGGADSLDPRTLASVIRCMAGLHQRPLTPELARIRCPTLIVVGENDFLGVGGSVILHRNISGSGLEIVPGRGHGVFLEDPEGFNALVSGFLDQVRETAGTAGPDRAATPGAGPEERTGVRSRDRS